MYEPAYKIFVACVPRTKQMLGEEYKTLICF